jgi:hypothetical protein
MPTRAGRSIKHFEHAVLASDCHFKALRGTSRGASHLGRRRPINNHRLHLLQNFLSVRDGGSVLVESELDLASPTLLAVEHLDGSVGVVFRAEQHPRGSLGLAVLAQNYLAPDNLPGGTEHVLQLVKTDAEVQSNDENTSSFGADGSLADVDRSSVAPSDVSRIHG